MPMPNARRFWPTALILLGAGCTTDSLPTIGPLISADSLAAIESLESGTEDAFSVLRLQTPDGLGQTVHPDYAMMPDWLPRRYLVVTPYAYSDSLIENPSLFAQYRSLGFEWQPFGLSNPVVRRTHGYLSDPDLVALPDAGELWLYYREVTSRNRIWLVRSMNGISWTDPVRVVSAKNHRIVSPAVVRRSPRDWMMWSVNAGRAGCGSDETVVELRRSVDGIHWSLPQKVPLSQGSLSVWHIDVQWIPSREEFWALYNVKARGNCNTQLLFLATSRDGIEWTTYPSPVLRSGVIPEFSDIVYRSTFFYNSRTDNIRFWFSGASHDERGYVWRTVKQRRMRADVFASISAPFVGVVRSPTGSAPLVSPPLI
jgi:hypothetical protein